MISLIDKLTSYKFFNYLLPGVIFATLSEKFTSYTFLQDDILVGFFVYYFIGMVVSRCGSLFLEPILKKIGFVKFAPYEDYVSASKNDPKIDIISEENNVYRSISSVFILFIFLKFYEYIGDKYTPLTDNHFLILSFVFFIVFLLAYRKQTKFITERIDKNK